jgi:hypothetical protein
MRDRKGNYDRISGCYEVNIASSEDGATATAIEWKVIDEKMDEKLTGSYFLRTNLVTMGAKELWQLIQHLEECRRRLSLYEVLFGLTTSLSSKRAQS